jgi:2-methylisocitrate lyase-like PEP mutase family enzyme
MGRRFRQLLQDEDYVFTGGVYSPLDAQIAQRVGLKAVYMSGYSVAMASGWPDMGFLTMTEMTRTASMIAGAGGIPVIADADDGYGNALSTMRTVQEYIKTGVDGVHLEDQRFPKRCGHIAGKTVVSREEAVGKFRAAVDVRDRLDPDFVLVARTDDYGAVGGSLEEAIRRGRDYADAGVDLVGNSTPAVRTREGCVLAWSIQAAQFHERILLQLLSASELAELPVERADGQVTGLASDLEDQAVGKAQAPVSPVGLERGGDDLGILDRQALVVQEHVDGRRDRRRTEVVDSAQHPGRLGENQVGDPRAGGHERLRGRDLPGLVARDQADEDIRVNGAHAVSACTGASPRSSARWSSASARAWGRASGARPRRSSAPRGGRRWRRRVRPTPGRLPGPPRGAGEPRRGPRPGPGR